MWSRVDLKNRAKAVLRTNYWKAFLISLVIAFATGGNGSGSSNGGRNSFENHSGVWNMPDISTGYVIAAILLIIAVASAVIVFFTCLRIFLGYPLEVGGRRYFIKSAQYDDNRGCFTFAFTGGRYKGIVLTMLLKGVKNFLWYLLFIIPGIVKAYSYSMVPYILAENPDIGASRAIELSKNMTDGHKMDMFILDLSFLGWYLLGFIAFVIGTFFVFPYHNATKAELYLVLKENAFNGGYWRTGEL
ncbi:MAG: hypothetical protein K0R50_3753 [Eubacterium sp.]|jgi:hypothetical protein|nr:hypothetical protein [Eubacterium sp.]